MISLFDYVFFRAYEFFFERGDIVPETRGALILSLLQFLTILDLLLIAGVVYPFSAPNPFYIGILIIPIAIINRYRYETIDFEKIRRRWTNEDIKSKKRNGWIISIYLAVSASIPVIVGSNK